MAEQPIPEEWRPAPGHPKYEVSNLGHVRHVRYRRVLKASQMGRYHCVHLEVNVATSIHTLVCLTFHGPKPSPMHHAAHWNGDRSDNRAVNLRWATPKENDSDKDRHGVRVNGERVNTAKLTPDDVVAIRLLYAGGGVTLRSIGVHYGVNKTTIRHVVQRTTWKHVP